MNIGILGGFFNPPHIGHMLVARQVLDFGGVDEIWFLPAFKSTFNKQLISAADRLNMINLVKIPHTEVKTLEIDHKLSGETIEILPILKQNPANKFTFIIGSDQLPTFHKWGQWEKLLKELPFLIVPRAGYPLKPLYPGMTLLKHPLLITTNISSSMVRERVKNGLNIDHFVIPKVKEYIVKQKLYR